MPSYGDIELASWSEPARQEAGALTAGDVVAAIEKACGGLTAWPGGSVAREACLALVDRYAAQVAKQAVADALSFDGVDATRKNVEREVNEARQRAEAAERNIEDMQRRRDEALLRAGLAERKLAELTAAADNVRHARAERMHVFLARMAAVLDRHAREGAQETDAMDNPDEPDATGHAREDGITAAEREELEHLRHLSADKGATIDALKRDFDAARAELERYKLALSAAENNAAQQIADRDARLHALSDELENERVNAGAAWACKEDLSEQLAAALARERGLREAAQALDVVWAEVHYNINGRGIARLEDAVAGVLNSLASKPASEPVAHHVLVDGAPYVASLDCCEATTHALEKERDALLAESTRRGMLIAALEAQRAKAPDAASELERAADALGERVELQAAKRDLRARAAALRGGEARGACGECERRERLLAMYRGEMRVIGEALAHTRENDKPAGEVEP